MSKKLNTKDIIKLSKSDAKKLISSDIKDLTQEQVQMVYDILRGPKRIIGRNFDAHLGGIILSGYDDYEQFIINLESSLNLNSNEQKYIDVMKKSGYFPIYEEAIGSNLEGNTKVIFDVVSRNFDILGQVLYNRDGKHLLPNGELGSTQIVLVKLSKDITSRYLNKI